MSEVLDTEVDNDLLDRVFFGDHSEDTAIDNIEFLVHSIHTPGRRAERQISFAAVRQSARRAFEAYLELNRPIFINYDEEGYPRQ